MLARISRKELARVAKFDDLPIIYMGISHEIIKGTPCLGHCRFLFYFILMFNLFLFFEGSKHILLGFII